MPYLFRVLLMALVTLMGVLAVAPVTANQPLRRPAVGTNAAPAFAERFALPSFTLGYRSAQAAPAAQLNQINTPTPDESPTATPRPTRTPQPTSTVEPTAAATDTPDAVATDEQSEATTSQETTPIPDEGDAEESAPVVEPTEVLTTATTTATTTAAITATITPTITTAISTTDEAPLEGTIVTNRSDNAARFFVEGAVYDLAARRSIGLALPRASSVLNLYNCDASTPETDTACFWDPYLVTQNGFYEIYNAPTETSSVRLLLREAGSPPTDQVWVQNRTGQNEQIVYENEVIDLLPTAVHELAVETGAPAILYVRNCVSMEGQSVCEWAPKTLDPGVYYALISVETPGEQPGTLLTAYDLRPVVAGVAAEAEVVEAAQATLPAPTGNVVCSLAVPALNIRSGPGLQYEIIGKVRTLGAEPATVSVNGRNADQQWLTVTPDVAEDGWITSSPSFITCEGVLADLPLVEAPAPPPTPVVQEPAPQPETAAPEVAESEVSTDSAPAETQAEQPPVEPTATGAASVAIPEGQSVLLVNNGFQYDIRFTLDQLYRPTEGPSEYDLPPGGSVAIVVHPGHVAFTASSPWGGLSDNAELEVAPNQSATLWLRFEPDPGHSGQWLLVWQ
jgi:hypothetical protein